MIKPELKSLAAFDVTDGIPTVLSDTWPNPEPPKDGAHYRWLHLDLTDAYTSVWLREHLPEIPAEALLQSETRPRCDLWQNGMVLNLRGVNLNPNSDPEDMVSLRLWITETSIISARMRKVWAVDTIRETASAGKAPKSVGGFLVEILNGLTGRIETVSLDLEDQTDSLEEEILGGKSLAPGALAGIRQAVIKMRRFVNPQREAVVALAGTEDWILTSDELGQLREASNRTRRTVEELDAVRDRLAALQEFVDADRAQVLGRNSYILSIVAAVFLPLGFLTGLFGVNVAGMPGTENEAAFWLLTALSVLAGVVILLVFKLSRWL